MSTTSVQTTVATVPPLTFRSAQWRTLGATMFCYLFYYTGRQTFGFALPGMEHDLGISKATLGWISAGMLWCYAIGGSISGNFGDKFGGRRMMSLGAALSCGMNWVTSFGFSVPTLLIPWSVNGLFQSMGWSPASRTLSNWWGHEERGKAYGLLTFSAGLGSILAFATSTMVLSLGWNWRWIFRIPTLLMLVGGLTYYLVVRDRPSELGFTVVNAGDSSNEPVEGESSLHRYLGVLKNPRFVIACLAIGFQNVARYGLLLWVPVHFLGTNWKQQSAGQWISTALPVGMALGALCSGWMSDRLFPNRRSLGISLSMALAGAAALLMYALPTRSPIAIPMLFLTGFLVYGPQSAFWALCPDLLGARRAGTGTGLMDMSAYLFAGLGEPFVGWMIQSHHNHTALIFPIVATSCFSSAVISVFIGR
jgi:OPA family glycerol-3-phosphate transporter-like MFS transporter